MATSVQSVNLLELLRKDPVANFLADGGSWADAIELDYTLNIPIWEGQLKGAVGRKGPSAERHKARLLKHLQEAYSYLGQPGKELERLAVFQREYEEAQAAKGKPKVVAVPKAGGAPKPKAGGNAWAALADSEED